MFVVSGSGVWTPASAARSQVQGCAHRRRSAALAATPHMWVSAVTPVPKASPRSAKLAGSVGDHPQNFPSESLVTPTPWASPWSTKSLQPSIVTMVRPHCQLAIGGVLIIELAGQDPPPRT